jgi:hypothetical protein
MSDESLQFPEAVSGGLIYLNRRSGRLIAPFALKRSFYPDCETVSPFVGIVGQNFDNQLPVVVSQNGLAARYDAGVSGITRTWVIFQFVQLVNSSETRFGFAPRTTFASGHL